MLVKLTTTIPTLLLNPNKRRIEVAIQMQSSNVDANNTGRIHVKTGDQPVATVGHASQGDILRQSDGILEPKGSGKIPKNWKGAIWATSSQNDQTLTVDEVLESSAEETPKE